MKQLLGPIILFLAGAVGAESPTYTLNQCVSIGLERAVPILNAKRDQEIAEGTMKKALATGLPQVDLLGSYTRNDENSLPAFSTEEMLRDRYAGSIVASQTIYDGGNVFSAIRAAKAYRGLTAQATEQAKADLILQIHIGFNGILLLQANVIVQEASVQQLTDFEKEARQKYDVGAVAEFDWLTAQVRKANETPKLIEARNILSIAKERFRNLIVLDSTEYQLDGELTYSPYNPDLMTLQSGAVSLRPELLVQEKRIILRQEDLKTSKSAYQPKVTAEALYTQENPDRYDGTSSEWSDHWTAGLVAKWTLFDSGTRKGDVLIKGMELAKSQANRDDLLREVSLDVKSTWLNMEAARELITGTEENVKLAEKALQIAKTRKNAGLSTYLEFTDSNLSLNTARLNYYRALEKHLNAVVNLKHAAGLLGKME
ncbi:MAG: TolC family protein [Kiritimatiellaceae bacterium]|nr:TolC family protein [Kiritimatiellaceae bacterium]